MNTYILNPKGFVLILVSILVVTFGTQSISYAQEANPTITASVEAPLTETTLDGSIVTLTLSGATYGGWIQGNDVSLSGVEGVTFDDVWGVDRVSDTELTVELTFFGDFDSNATLTFTVGARAIVGYNGNALTATLPVTAVEESLVASTEAPLMETTLHGSVVTLTLNGRQFVDRRWTIGDAVSASGISGVTVRSFDIDRQSDTEVTVELTFNGNLNTDGTLILTVGADAIAGYNGPALTAEVPVTAMQESIVASTELPLTEATLDGSVVTLTLSGGTYEEGWKENPVSVSGIEGVTVDYWWDVERVSDTELTVKLTFSGDFDSNATLTFTVTAEAIAGGYNQDLTAEVPVTARQQSNATVSISPSPVVSPNIGESLTFTLNIVGGENVAGYQATISFNRTALRPVNITNGDYLPMDAFFMDENFYREVRLAATTLAEASNGDGTLATLTFEVEDFKPSMLTLSEVYLVDTDGTPWETFIENGEVTIPPELENAILGDINRDGVVNIQDLTIVNIRFGQTGENSADINGDGIVNIVDLVLVAGAFGNGAAAPTLHPQSLEMLTAADIQRWLSQAQQLDLTDAASLKGILFLQQLLAALIPKETALLFNYPNPFNPETWIPYRLSKPADVTLTIYAVNGQMVRRLSLGHQPAGIYQSRSRAAHWDGKNKVGEPVASGLYFYTLTAGDFTATRKMLIRK